MFFKLGALIGENIEGLQSVIYLWKEIHCRILRLEVLGAGAYLAWRMRPEGPIIKLSIPCAPCAARANPAQPPRLRVGVHRASAAVLSQLTLRAALRILIETQSHR